MEDGLLSLKWNNHSKIFSTKFSGCRHNGDFTDITLACNGKFFKAHKLILGTCSDYFKEIFDTTDCKSPVIVLMDISEKHIENLLNYMYIGEVEVSQLELPDLISAAENLKIKGLATVYENNIESPKNITPPQSKKRKRNHENMSAAKRKLQQANNNNNNNTNNFHLNHINSLEETVKVEMEEPDEESESLRLQSTLAYDIENDSRYSSDALIDKDDYIKDEWSSDDINVNARDGVDDSFGTENSAQYFEELNLSDNHQVENFSKKVFPEKGCCGYKCLICGKVSSSKASFVRHYRTHTGERPYPCSLCEYRATQKVHLKYHLKSKHGEEILFKSKHGEEIMEKKFYGEEIGPE